MQFLKLDTEAKFEKYINSKLKKQIIRYIAHSLKIN